MNRMTSALVVMVLALTVAPAFANDEGPSREDTIEWIASVALAPGYEDGDYILVQRVYFGENEIRKEIQFQGPQYLFGDVEVESVDFSDLAVEVSLYPGSPGEVVLNCSKSAGTCVSRSYSPKDEQTRILDKLAYTSILVNKGMEERARNAFEHLIRLSGGKAAVNENLF